MKVKKTYETWKLMKLKKTYETYENSWKLRKLVEVKIILEC